MSAGRTFLGRGARKDLTSRVRTSLGKFISVGDGPLKIAVARGKPLSSVRCTALTRRSWTPRRLTFYEHTPFAAFRRHRTSSKRVSCRTLVYTRSRVVRNRCSAQTPKIGPAAPSIIVRVGRHENAVFMFLLPSHSPAFCGKNTRWRLKPNTVVSSRARPSCDPARPCGSHGREPLSYDCSSTASVPDGTAMTFSFVFVPSEKSTRPFFSVPNRCDNV